VAPPDRHLIVERGRIRLSRDPRENGSRPSVDVLFRTAADTYGPDVVGIVLSGALGDGAAGLRAVKSRGGLVVVQDPAEAPFTGMPRTALERVDVDMVLRAAEIGSLLRALAQGEVTGMAPTDAERARDWAATLEVASSPGAPRSEALPAGSVRGGPRRAAHVAPSEFVCPECDGTLFAEDDAGGLRYVCRIGHAYSPEGLDAAKKERVEQALQVALRSLDEMVDLSERMAVRAEQHGLSGAAGRFRDRSRDAAAEAAAIRTLLEPVPAAAEAAAIRTLLEPVPAADREVERTG
jgi:two-component system chemotaxis response regulator CheB